MCVSVGLTIGFTMTSINVTEGNTATICARVLEGDIARDVPIQFNTQPGTARGKNLRVAYHCRLLSWLDGSTTVDRPTDRLLQLHGVEKLSVPKEAQLIIII